MWIRISRQFHFDYVPEPLVTLRNHGTNVHNKVATMYEYQMRVIRRAFEEDPVDGRNLLLRRRSQADIHFDAGDEYLHLGEYRCAFRHLLHSFLLWPLDRRGPVYLARALARKPVTRRSLRDPPTR